MSKVTKCAERITETIYRHWEDYKTPLEASLLSGRFESEIHSCFGREYNLVNVLDILERAKILHVHRDERTKRWVIPIKAWGEAQRDIKAYIRAFYKSRGESKRKASKS